VLDVSADYTADTVSNGKEAMQVSGLPYDSFCWIANCSGACGDEDASTYPHLIGREFRAPTAYRHDAHARGRSRPRCWHAGMDDSLQRSLERHGGSVKNMGHPPVNTTRQSISATRDVCGGLSAAMRGTPT